MSEQPTNRMNSLARDARGGSPSNGSPSDGPAAGGPITQPPVSYPDLPDDASWTEKVDGLLEEGQHDHEESDEYPPAHDDEYEEDYEDAGAGFFDLVWEYKVYLIAFVLVIVVIIGLILGTRGAPDRASDASPAPTPDTPADAAPRANEELPVKETGVAMQEPVYKEDAGTYYLRAGSIAWKGKLDKTDTGEQLTLEGPTAAQFKRTVTLPGGSVMTGVFGRAEPGKPIVHATFHRTTIGQTESTSGTYYAIDGSDVIVEGTYQDARDGDTITRTYTEHSPGSEEYDSYRVSFDVPVGVPVPVLVGWEPPATLEKDEAA